MQVLSLILMMLMTTKIFNGFKPLSLVISIFSIFVFVSCEDVIEVKLKNAKSLPVIEGKLYDTPFLPASVRISESTEYFGSFEYKAVSEASVVIKNQRGDTLSVLSENSEMPGTYFSNFFGYSDSTYLLCVKIGEKEYSALSKMEKILKIDSLTASPNPTFPYQPTGQFYLHCHTANPAGRADFMQFVLYINNQPSMSFYLYDDTFSDGKSLDFKYFNESLMPGDTAIVQLLTMDKQTYGYVTDLSSAAVDGVGGPPSTPYNPHTNFTGGALGYFGAFGVDAKMVIAPK